MANSLITGISGLRVHQSMLDVVGNNLANSNTIGYKSQRARFSDVMYQTLGSATASSEGAASGTNPIQLGMGARVAGVDPNMQQGSLEATGQDLDLALQGDGFFVARYGNQNLFTRAGAFSVDKESFLVDPSTGFRVQRFGSVGEGDGVNPPFQAAGNRDIILPVGTGIPGRASTSVNFQGNLSASAAGPLAHVLTAAQPFRAGGVAATAATLLNALDSNTADYVAGDQLRLQGVDAAGSPVSVTVGVGPAATLGDLVSAINANFPGSTASLTAAGTLVVQSNTTGATQLTVAVSDVVGSTGSTAWNGHSLQPTTIGRDGDTVQTGIQIYDQQGRPHTVSLVFQKQANNVWDLQASLDPSEGTMVDDRVTGITFNEDGSFRQVSGSGLGDGVLTFQFNGFSTPQTISMNFGPPGEFSGIIQVGGNSSAAATGQDGFAAGVMTSVSIGQDGVINGVFSNGRMLPVAQLAVASFANPAALDRIGENYYNFTSQSGPALLGPALSGARGGVRQRTLESSNVDVAQEFSRLIIAQRGFQVNARTITASDQVLQELANILR